MGSSRHGWPLRRRENRATGLGIGLTWLLALAALSFALPATAQVQRSFVNASFEQPNLVTAGCRVYIADAQVPGYATTHPPIATANNGNCVVPAGFAQTAPVIEIWRTPRDNASGGIVRAPDGLQIAELNAETASRIYQNVCLINGESINWRFNHRGRGSATVPDQAELKLGAAATVVRVGTTNTGVFLAPVTSIGTSNAPVNVAGNATWVRYTGNFTYSNATGITSLGFEAIGGGTSGNLLDDIQIDLKPFVEFAQASSSTPESASNNIPTLRVNGTAFAPVTVTVQITGGTATLGTDYTTPNNSDTFTVTIPGSATGIQYDGVSAGSRFALPITVTNDALVEGNETINFRIVRPTATPLPFLLSSSAVCGGTPQETWIYTIVDDDSSVSVIKNSAAPVAVSGQPTQFDIAYTVLVNNPSASVAANYSLTDTPGFDPDTSIVSANFTFNGGAATALPAATPWTLQPQWRTLPAGQTDTYVVTVRFNIVKGGSVANDSCASPSTSGNGLHNSATATVQGTGGNPNGDFSDTGCENTPTPAWVILRKQLQGRVVPTDQAQIRIYAGGNVAATATTAGTATPSNVATTLLVVPGGTTLQFEEAIKTNGTGADRAPVAANYRPQIACTSSGAPVAGLPSGSGNSTATSQLWPDFTGVAGADVDCTITNAAAAANLGITKTNNATTVVSGGTTTYSIVVTNAGPSAADNATVRDTPTTGLTCSADVTCTSSGGAVCPNGGTITATAFQAGVQIPTLPANGSLTFAMRCTVN